MAGDRFTPGGSGQTMKAVVTIANGGYDKLVHRDVAVPVLAPGEVLVRVLAAGVNNTEINTRVGWYARSWTPGTRGAEPHRGWNVATPFPFIQGAERFDLLNNRLASIDAGEWLL